MAMYDSMDLLGRIDNLLPDKIKESIHKGIQNNFPLPGFRKGAAPFNRIWKGIGKNRSNQQKYLTEVAKFYYPEIPIKDLFRGDFNINYDGDDIEKLPGKMALYLLKAPFLEMGRNLSRFDKEKTFYTQTILNQKEDDLPEETTEKQEKLEDIAKPRLEEESVTAGITNETIDDTAVQEISEEESVLFTEISPAPEDIPEGNMIPQNLIPERTEGQDTEENTENTERDTDEEYDLSQETIPQKAYRPEEVMDPIDDEPMFHHEYSGTEYLGHIQVIDKDVITIFTNFIPLYRIEHDGKFSILTEAERKGEFPDMGGVHVRSNSLNYKIIPKRLKAGQLYIADLNDFTMNEDPDKQNRMYFNLENLQSKQALGEPHTLGFQVYQVYNIQDLEQKLASGSDVLVTPYASKMNPNSFITLRDGGKIYGPFPLKINKMGQTFIKPVPREKKYVFDVYLIRENPSAIMPIQYHVGRNGEENISVEMVDLSRLTHYKKDLMSDKILAAELQTCITERKDSDLADFTSLLIGLPPRIEENRRKRIQNYIQEEKAMGALLDEIPCVVEKVLLEVAKKDEANQDFELLFNHLANSPEFLDNFSKSRQMEAKYTEKQRELESRLHSLRTEISEAKHEKENLNSLKARQEQARINELKRLEARYKALQEVYDIADNVEEMKELESSIQKSIDEKKAELETLSSKVSELEKHFTETMEKPVSRIAEVLMDKRISKMLTGHRNPSNTEFQEEPITAEEPADRVVLAEETIKDAVLPDELIKRFKKYRPHYGINEILNAYICFTQNFLTVFSGAPGTGKTTACSILAHSLGLDSEKNNSRFIFVPVERGWSSKRDFIGFFNPLTKCFDQSLTQVCRALDISDAECKADQQLSVPPLAILLDEANLSPIEYYLASFLNVMEGDTRTPLVDMGSGISYRISKSMRFLATINNDQTTESLSPRLIDRSWVITLPEGSSNSKPLKFDENDKYAPIPMAQMQRVFGDTDRDETRQDLVSAAIMQKVYEICRNGNMDVSSRTKGAILSYCRTGERIFRDFRGSSQGPAHIAADFAVTQRILPKIQGYGEGYQKRLLNPLREYLEREKLPRSAEMIRKIINNGSINMFAYHFFD